MAVACLVHPLPAGAAPAPLPDWGVKDKGKKPDAAKPADKPADAKPGTAALPDWGVAGKPKARKPKARKPKAGEAAPAEPAEPIEPAEPEATPAEPASPAEPAAPAEPAPEPAPAEAVGPAPEPEAAAVPGPTDQTAAAQQLRRRGRAELITGAVFMAAGLTGFGVLGAGVFIKRSADQELEEAEGRTDVDLEPLNAQRKQGETMLAAGAVAGVIGMALGVALVGAGARDMKRGRAGLTARLRVAPTLGGLVISGRF